MTQQAVRTQTVAMLVQPGPNPEIVVNAVKAAFPNLVVIEEEPESKALFIRRRAKKLGWIQALGQLATMVVSKYGKRFTTKRAAEILDTFGADPSPDPAVRRVAVSSANGPAFLAAIAEIRPAALLLVSTRMLKAETLAAIPCPVLNLHAGINPQYRGLQGGYWSRVLSDEANFGTTIHLVDAGVDTGGVLHHRQPQALENSGTVAAMVSSAHLDMALERRDPRHLVNPPGKVESDVVFEHEAVVASRARDGARTHCQRQQREERR